MFLQWAFYFSISLIISDNNSKIRIHCSTLLFDRQIYSSPHRRKGKALVISLEHSMNSFKISNNLTKMAHCNISPRFRFEEKKIHWILLKGGEIDPITKLHNYSDVVLSTVMYLLVTVLLPFCVPRLHSAVLCALNTLWFTARDISGFITMNWRCSVLMTSGPRVYAQTVPCVGSFRRAHEPRSLVADSRSAVCYTVLFTCGGVSRESRGWSRYAVCYTVLFTCGGVSWESRGWSRTAVDRWGDPGPLYITLSCLHVEVWAGSRGGDPGTLFITLSCLHVEVWAGNWGGDPGPLYVTVVFTRGGVSRELRGWSRYAVHYTVLFTCGGVSWESRGWSRYAVHYNVLFTRGGVSRELRGWSRSAVHYTVLFTCGGVSWESRGWGGGGTASILQSVTLSCRTNRTPHNGKQTSISPNIHKNHLTFKVFGMLRAKF